MTERTKKRIIRWVWILGMTPLMLIFTLMILAATGVFGYMPTFEELENPKSNIASEIYGDNGEIIGTFFIENRSYVQYEDLMAVDSANNLVLNGRLMPPVVAALISTEDLRFYSHSGIDITSLFRVGLKTIIMRNTAQGGGSTITQQLAKNLFPREGVAGGGIARAAKLGMFKIKEWVTALKLEYNYTKEEIAAMYLNTVGYGTNAFGIKSASRIFFDKAPNELNIQEAALLVGVVNAPSRYSPVYHPEAALQRRNLVLKRMETSGALTTEIGRAHV